MFNTPINATTGYTAPKAVRVSRNVGKVEDSSSVIRFASFAILATVVVLVAYKAIAVVA